jgi:hypothetical protein
MTEFQSYKTELSKSRQVATDQDAALANLKDGDVLVRIDRFAFTSNNVTYGVAGDTIGYWQFFPAQDNAGNEWGCLPVWGFADVTASKAEGLEVGERIYGYFPPASFLTLSPIKLSAKRFVDGAAHRKELPPVYNNYVRLSGDETYDPSMDDIRALLYPLHLTAFCLCDALEDASYFGAKQVIIVSASSKTAIGLAQGLAQTEGSPRIIGLTSSANRSFVEALGCYDQVICYDELDTIDSDQPSVMVDMSGNRSVLGTVHAALGDNMLNCLNVGMTHWDEPTDADGPLAGQMIRERSSFFFAPAHIQKRMGDWGQDGYEEQTSNFMAERAKQSLGWMKVEHISGFDAFAEVYSDMVEGKVNPNEGLIIVV